MSKTPVSLLQEYSAKQSWGLPNYTLISHTSRSRSPSFTYKIMYNSQTAFGTATSKKEAKHIAAKEMLKLLSQPENILAMTKTESIALPQMSSYHLPAAYNVANNDIFINSVGKLNEHCAINKLKTPNYQVVDEVGPSHAMSFTIVCCIGELETTATANTKKQAKHDAAQEMLNILVRNTNFNVTHNGMATSNATDNMENLMSKVDILDLKIQEPLISSVDSSKKAKTLFPILRCYTGRVKVANNTSAKDYHGVFKNSINPDIRKSILQDLHTQTTNANSEELLHRIAELLGLHLDIELLLNIRDRVIVTCSLDSTPVISDTGVGATLPEARKHAITNILESIVILLT